MERGAASLGRDKPRYADLIRSLLAIDTPDYLQAAQHLREQMGGARWAEFLKANIDLSHADANPASLDLARAIWRLGTRLLITTNYDRVLDWACPWHHDLVRLDNTALAELAMLVREALHRPTIWHLHGHIDNVDGLVLTPDGYHKLYLGKDSEARYQAALEVLRMQMASRTLLFIGFSLDDAFLGMQISGVFELFRGYTSSAYALVHRSEIERVRAKNLPVELVPFDEFGPPLVALVHELASLSHSNARHVPETLSSVSTLMTPGRTATPSQSRAVVPEPEENPFNQVTAIREPERFIGRDSQYRRLCRLLDGGSVALIGAPKIGKSSLLYQLVRTWPGNVLGPLDLQGIEETAHFYEELGALLGLARVSWRELRNTLRDRHILLLLDELDSGPRRCLDSEHLMGFRSLCSQHSGCKLVSASRQPVKEVFPDTHKGSPAYNFLQPLELREFSADEARVLLAHPWAPAAQHFEPATVDEILALAGGHPFLLQRGAFHCYEALLEPELDWRSAWQLDREHML
jgi:hypothetical protein